jgi:hypothetical protein
MPIDFRRGHVSFDPTQGQIQSEQGAVVFPSNVIRADVSIAGYDIRYNNGDHHIFRQIIDPVVESIQGSTVFFRINFLLRDSSGSIDDPFSGIVNVLVIAEVEQPRLRLPTGLVTGAAVAEQ